MDRGGKRAWFAAIGATAALACAAHAPPAGPTGGPLPDVTGPSASAPPSAPASPLVSEPPTSMAPPASPHSEPRPPRWAGLLDAAPPASLEACGDSADRIGLAALLFAREDRPTLLEERLLISGIDPRDVRDFLQAYNRRSEFVQFTPEGVAFAPHALERMLSLPPTQLLQFRFSGQTGKLVFRLVFP